MSLAARLDVPDSRRGKGPASVGRSLRNSPYNRPSSQLPEARLPADGNWVHDKFAEVNDIPKAGGALAARMGGGTTGGAGAKLLQKALGDSGAGSSRLGAGGRVPSGGSLSIKGASAPSSTTLEIRELVAGTTAEDVKAIFSQCGQITDAWVVPSGSSSTTVIRVTFTDRAGMTQAIKKFDQEPADGRVLSVKEVVAPSVAKVLDTAMELDSVGSKGKMYSDSIDGGVTITRPPRIDIVSDKWTRGGGGGGGNSRSGRGRGRGRSGRGRGASDSMQVD